MIVKLYDGPRLVGQLEVGSRKPHTIRVTHSVGAQMVGIGVGLGDRLMPAGEITEVYTKRLTIGLATSKSQVRYVLSKRIGADEPAEPPRREERAGVRRVTKTGVARGGPRVG